MLSYQLFLLFSCILQACPLLTYKNPHFGIPMEGSSNPLVSSMFD